MLLYLFAIQSLSLAVTNLVNSRHLSAGLTGVTSLCLSLASGVAVHHEEVGIWAAWLRYASPLWWMQHPLLQVKKRGKFPLNHTITRNLVYKGFLKISSTQNPYLFC